MKKLFLALFLLVVAAVSSAYVPDVSYTPRAGVGDDKQSYYGTATNPSYTFKGDEDTGLYRIGANSFGIATGGTKRLGVSSTGVSINGFITNELGSTVSTSATTNATITPARGYVLLGTWINEAISTVNLVTTANVPIGSILILQTADDDHDIVFLETGNLSLGGTRTLDDSDDVLAILKVAANKFVELFFVSNN